MATDPLPIQRVTENEMRRLFNESQFRERVLAGEFTQQVRESRHPSLPKAPVPFCTESQLLSYFDAAGQEVAKSASILVARRHDRREWPARP
jgi:hypothetical protein